MPNAPYPTGVTSGTGAGGGWGEQKALMDAQAAVPVASPPPPGSMGPPMPPAAPGPAPGSLGAFGRPSDRPNEPTTHGLPTGPGGGPEVLRTQATAARTLIQQLANSPYASDDLRDLLNLMG